MDLQVGDILLKKGTAIGAVLIRELTADGVPFSSSYSHCGIYAGNGKVWDARTPVIDSHTLDYGEFDVRRMQLTADEQNALMGHCEAEKGIPYAVEGVADMGIEQLFHIPIGIHLHGEEWCSMFVNYVFTKLGKPLTRKPYPTPNDIGWSVAVQPLERG